MLSVILFACNEPLKFDADADGFTVARGDCDDAQPGVNPDATEHCDGVDEDCDGVVDEEAADATIRYADVDGDGFGGTAIGASCEDDLPSDGDDCDDAEPSVHPGAAEHCDGVDEDCDGEVDEDAVEGDTWFADADGDGTGAAGSSVTACAQPDGYVARSDDCDDTDAEVCPACTELCDGVDDDCDGLVDEAGDAGEWYCRDADADGYGDPDDCRQSCEDVASFVVDATDCDDTDPDVHAGAEEFWGDGVDQDCDGCDDCVLAGTAVASAADAVIEGVNDYGQLGNTISTSGDLDGDGVADLLVSSPTRWGTWAQEGRVMAFTGPWTGSISPASAAATWTGDGEAWKVGWELAIVGDLDGDGTEDAAMSGTNGPPDYYGRVWLAYGPLGSGDRLLALEDDGWATADYFQALEAAGDTDGDGLSEIILGSYTIDTAWLVGATSGMTDVAEATWTLEAPGTGLGHAVAGVGDLNLDGYDDVIAGAPASSLYYLCHGPLAGENAWDTCTGTLLGEAADYAAQAAIVAASDVNVDGVPDLLVGATGPIGTPGAAYLVLGPVSGTVALSTAAVRWDGAEYRDYAGGAVAAGDIDGDGFPEALIGSYRAFTTGGAFLMDGASLTSGSLADAAFVVAGDDPGDDLGAALGVGDLDGDGLGDLVVGALGDDTTGRNAGSVGVFLGR